MSVVERADRDALLQKASYVRYEESDSDEEEQPTTLKTALVAALVEVHSESRGTAGLRELLPPSGCRGEERSIGTAPATQAGRSERTSCSQ